MDDDIRVKFHGCSKIILLDHDYRLEKILTFCLIKSLMQGEQNVITCLGYTGPENGYYLLRALPKMIIYLGYSKFPIIILT